MDHAAELVAALTEARRLGMIGAAPVERAIEHANWFTEALAPLAPGSRIVDLGSGAGLPGLVVASARRDLEIVLVDRRTKRTDFLERMVSRLDLRHVEVRGVDASVLVDEVRRNARPFDAATARGFGPPEVTLRTATALVRRGGWMVVSEPPVGDRWSAELLDELGLVGVTIGAVRRFEYRT